MSVPPEILKQVKGIARDEREARAILRRHAEEEEGEEVVAPLVVASVDEPLQEETPVEPQPIEKGWKPDVLTDDSLIPEELEILAKIKAYAQGRSQGRCKAFKRFLCDGGVL